jgi:hypothetical protein
MTSRLHLHHKKYKGISEAVALIAGIGVAVASIAIVYAYMQSQGQILQRNIDVKYDNLTLMLAPSDLVDCGVHNNVTIVGKVTNTGNVDLRRILIEFRDRNNNVFASLDTSDIRPSDNRQVGWSGNPNVCMRAGEINNCQIVAWRRDTPNAFDTNIADLRIPCKYRVVQ